MSVILFDSRSAVFADMSHVYEGMKRFVGRPFNEDADYVFYKALRRLYFANVGCFLCQYHTGGSTWFVEELTCLDTFMGLKKDTRPQTESVHELVELFSNAWGSLKYNLVTNDGEEYQAIQSYELMEELLAEYQLAAAYF